MLMSRSTTYKFTCACGASFTTPVYEAVNVTLEPQLLYTLLAGLLNVATCSNCGRRTAIARPFLYHDVARDLFAYVHPRADLPEEQRERLLQHLRRAYVAAVEQSMLIRGEEPLTAPEARLEENEEIAGEVLSGADVSPSDAPSLQIIFGMEQLCELVNSLLGPEERLGKLALSSKSKREDERRRLLAVAGEMARQMDCQVEIDDEPGEYTVWLYGPRRAIGAIMRELAPRQ
jgi:CpXC protein